MAWLAPSDVPQRATRSGSIAGCACAQLRAASVSASMSFTRMRWRGSPGDSPMRRKSNETTAMPASLNQRS
jgi:hypothetical protein